MKRRAWITVVEPADARQELARAYAQVGARDGDVSNILAVQSLDPSALSAHYQLYRTLMYAASPLTRTQREAIAVVVSLANDCHY
jgi:alkylhydroperoxidase family enzyme